MSDIKHITPDAVADLARAGTDAFIVDLREPRDCKRDGAIPETVFLPADHFADRYARELDPEDEIILVCEHGKTSEAAARFLASQGYENVATMTGGMAEYRGPRVTL